MFLESASARRSVIALVNAVAGLTIAQYSAAISSGLRDGAGCRRGGIVGRWTKPIAARRVCDIAPGVSSLSRPQVGELYPGSRDTANLD